MHGHSSSPPASFAGGAPGADRVLPRRVRLRRSLCGAALLAATSTTASAYTATLNPAAPLTVYLQVGVGSFTANYNAGGQPQNNATINVVSTTVASAAVGNGTAQSMTTNSSAANSFLDGYLFCNVPGQLYIGGFYRTTGPTTAAAQVVATVPAALTDATGGTIPFSKITWTSGGNGPGNATEPFPAGTFVNGGTQNVGSMASNTWNESCWTYSYLNNTVPAAGTFSGRVLYTLSAP
jgi:hypothetical protein